MNLEEARSIMKVSDEEILSIKEYLGLPHTRINILGDLSAKNYSNLSKDWVLAETPKEIEELINHFVNVYSAMYKSSKENTPTGRFYRGTSKANIPTQGTTIGQLLSTSNDMTMAQSFGNGEPALITIVPDSDVPFLDAELFRDEDRRDESEFIFAPFCKAEKVEYQGKRDVYTYYRMRISKIQLLEKTDEEIAELIKFIKENFTQNIADIKQENNFKDDRYIWFMRWKNAQESDDKTFAWEKIEEIDSKISEYSQKTNAFRDKLQELLMGLCRQRELQIDEAYQVIEQDRARIREETKAKVRNDIRQTYYDELQPKLANSPKKEEELASAVLEQYRRLQEIEKEYMELSRKLGLISAENLPHTNIGKKVEEIQSNLSIVRQELGTRKISPKDSYETVVEMYKEINPTLDGVLYGLEISKDLPNITRRYEEQSKRDLKKKLFFKVHGVLSEARVQKLLVDREEIKSEGVGFFGGLSGKNDLQLARLENIRLKIEVAQTTVPEEPEEYSVRDMLADMHACAMTEFGGNFTPEMSKLYQNIIQNFGIGKGQAFSEEEIQRRAREKKLASQATLPVVQDGKKNRFLGKTKSQIELLKLENASLNSQILQNRTQNRMPQFSPGKPIETDPLVDFDLKLKGIEAATRKSELVRGKITDRTFDLFS